MQLVKLDRAISKPVKRWSEISVIVKEMQQFIATNKWQGNWNDPYCLAHCQVSNDHYAFFVVNPKYVGKKSVFQHPVVINPKIVEMIEPAKRMKEACMSYPFRTAKNVQRSPHIKVEYQVKGLFGLKTIQQEVGGIVAQIFQHETDHMHGHDIFFNPSN